MEGDDLLFILVRNSSNELGSRYCNMVNALDQKKGDLEKLDAQFRDKMRAKEVRERARWEGGEDGEEMRLKEGILSTRYSKEIFCES